MSNGSDDHKQRGGSRALERAVKHARAMWLPINAVNLKEIHRHFDSGRYESDKEGLISDICRDAHLFTYCLKELCGLLGTCSIKDPLETLRNTELDTLRQILSFDSSKGSPHTLTGASPLQVARLEEGLISSAATQAFGAALDIASDVAASAAVLHQLGLTLICWNYPGLYEAAAQEITAERSLEIILTERLGFSPATLAAAVFGTDSLPEFGPALNNAIRVGETLARANQPHLYPTAAADWAQAKEEITRTLGDSGLKTISDYFVKLSEPLVDAAPSLFSVGLLLDPEVRMAQALAASIRQSNPYLPRCRKFVADRLENLYRSLQPGVPSSTGTRALLKQIVPVAGFHAATVFTVDPLTASLVPQLSLSDHRLHEPRSETEVTLLNEALGSEAPVLLRDMSGEEILLAQSLGLSGRFGVLLVAIKPAFFEPEQQQVVTHLQALALTLTHSLTGRS